MNFPIKKQSRIDDRLIILLVLALVKLFIHLYTNAFASYEIYRDEFYYIACSDRLALGYVDQPPLSIYILFLSRALFGESLFALRFLPALAGALTVFMSGIIVRKLAGGRFAVLIAGVTSIAAPILLGMNTFYSMNSFDILLWSLIAYVLILLIKDNKPVHWITLGVLIGLGLLNKTSMAWFAIGIFIAFIITSRRKVLLTRWPYIAGLIAFGIFSPYILWNITNDFAHLEFILNATANKYRGVTPTDFLTGQILLMLPISVFIWLSGVYYFLFAKDGKNFNVLGISLLTVVLILLINGHSKPEYLSPTYPILFASGAVFIERIVKIKYAAWLKYAIPILVIILGSVAAPFALPCLPVETYIKYSQRIGIDVESHEGHELTELHQF
jgi:4-amino-4-deoxy-L-arabinose transferase-like glycosyltransferase